MVRCDLRAALGMILVVMTSANAWADTSWDRAALAKLFEIGWDRSPEARPVEEDLYSQLAVAAKGDWRLTYATVLIRMKQLRFQDALKLTDEILQTDKKNISVWKTKIWVTVLTKGYSQALADLEKLADVFPEPVEMVETPPMKELETLTAAASFMGRVIGYLEGPVASSTSEAVRTATRKKIAARLPARYRKPFDDGRQTVTDQYLALTDQAIATKEKVKEEQEEEKDEKLKELEEEQRDLEKRRSDLSDRRDKLRAELQSEINMLQQQDRPLAAQYNRLDAEAGGLRRQLSFINNDINRLQSQIDRERDPNLRDRLRDDIRRLQFSAGRLDNQLSGIIRQANTIAAQRAQIQAKANQKNLEYGGQISNVDKDLSSIERRTKGARNEEKKVRKETVGDTPQIRAKSIQAASFITYEPYPLELERQRVLDSLP